MTGPERPSAAEFKQQQREGWAKNAAAWRKWSAEMAVQSRAATELILQIGVVRSDLQVLDLASGAGEPALSLADAVAPGGHVTATDLAPEMVAGLAELAAERGLTNLTTREADIEALPFPDESFDLATCRFGIMFCPDPAQGLREVRRVLRSGGRTVLVVWGTPNQPFFNTTFGVVRRHLQWPDPPPGAPTPFRFAEPGSLGGALQAAGFREVQEQSHIIPWPLAGTPERAWEMMREVTGMVIPPEQADTISKDVIAALSDYYDGTGIDLTAQIISATGVR